MGICEGFNLVRALLLGRHHIGEGGKELTGLGSAALWRQQIFKCGSLERAKSNEGERVAVGARCPLGSDVLARGGSYWADR